MYVHVLIENDFIYTYMYVHNCSSCAVEVNSKKENIQEICMYKKYWK